MEEVLYIYNKPSIIDLYIDCDKINNNEIIERLKNTTNIGNIISIENRNQIIKVEAKYDNNIYYLYLQILANKNNKLSDTSNVLVNDNIINKAKNKKFFIKSSLDTKHNFVNGYYYQLKVLNALSDEALLINDNSQGCLYSAGYLKQMANSNINIVATNLFKIRFDTKLCLYTQGLDRFGIKEIVMILNSEYYEEQVALLSRLARYYIEHGQVSNSVANYCEILENDDIGCLLEFSNLIDEYKEDYVKKVVNDLLINEDYLLFSLHESTDIDNYLISDITSLDKLRNNNVIYMSNNYFEQNKQLAQDNIIKVIELLDQSDEASNLMILALNDNLDARWYYYDDYVNDKIIIKSNNNILAINKSDVLDFNYKGITPLYSYCLFE
ncbi:MAG: hypothetical protein LBR40_01215 [Bacilli bacterium]|jgi:hypothetical protein|nr:hypothetical protein [Bacilli bacterium]